MCKATKTWFSIYAWDNDNVIGISFNVMEPRARDFDFARKLCSVLGFCKIKMPESKHDNCVGRTWDVRDPDSLENAREFYYWQPYPLWFK